VRGQVVPDEKVTTNEKAKKTFKTKMTGFVRAHNITNRSSRGKSSPGTDAFFSRRIRRHIPYINVMRHSTMTMV
jgi:hypothetical protein